MLVELPTKECAKITCARGLRRLATEIYPPLLDAVGLVVALRSAAADAGIVARVEADVISGSDPEVVTTVYFCCHHCKETFDRDPRRHAVALAG